MAGIYYPVVKGDPLNSGGNGQIIGGSPHCAIEGPDGQDRVELVLDDNADASGSVTESILASIAG
ncbi:hypothetical protein OKW38_005183 [Paraburkholderia sp. MM5496-R1]|uniref:hypothetical protein n=1 Tax=unclassified Paraburkholderia TaxID=2615204 RepID=UPI00165642AC|nr:hypothetical protein [Paraburkholderia sp. UCT2]MBC8729463.1 hypothetical protein [Paraburkholderia sp. UCT2]